MKLKTIFVFLLLILSIDAATATYEQINETLYVYNESHVRYRMIEGLDTNCEDVICEHGICTEMNVGIAIKEDYDFDYELYYYINSSTYHSSIITIKQEEISSNIFSMYRRVKRTAYIDGIQVATYNASLILGGGTKSNFGFNSIDQSFKFGSITIKNTSLFYNELTLDDQYNFLVNNTGANVGFNILTTSEFNKAYNIHVLGGFTGIFLSVIKKMPFIGDALYNVLYPVVTVIQYVINFTFFVLNLIINDFWYALVLLECVCMFMASKQSGYVNVVQTYVTTHVTIILTLYHKVVLPILNLLLIVLNTIKNMIQWW